MILCNSGPLIAASIRDNDDHRLCVDLFSALHLNGERLLVPPTVIAEVGYMLERLGSPAHEAAFLRSVAASDFEPIDLTAADYARMSELVEHYDDLPLGTFGSCARATLTRLFSSPTLADPSCIGHLTTAASASHLGCLLSRRVRPLSHRTRKPHSEPSLSR